MARATFSPGARKTQPQKPLGRVWSERRRAVNRGAPNWWIPVPAVNHHRRDSYRQFVFSAAFAGFISVFPYLLHSVRSTFIPLGSSSLSSPPPVSFVCVPVCACDPCAGQRSTTSPTISLRQSAPRRLLPNSSFLRPLPRPSRSQPRCFPETRPERPR